MQWYWIVPVNVHLNHDANLLSVIWSKYLYPYNADVPSSLKKTTEFSLELDISFKSFSNNLETTALCSITCGSPSLCTCAISKNLENLPALSKKPNVVPREIGFVAKLKL